MSVDGIATGRLVRRDPLDRGSFRRDVSAGYRATHSATGNEHSLLRDLGRASKRHLSGRVKKLNLAWERPPDAALTRVR